MGDRKWEMEHLSNIARTSNEHRSKIYRTSNKIHRRSIENGNASKIHEIPAENPFKSTENWKSKEHQARIHVKIHRRHIENGKCIEHP